MEAPYETSSGGGISAYLRALIPVLADAGHRVTVVARTRRKEVQTLCGGKVKIVPAELPGSHWYLSKVPLLSRFTHPVRQLEWSQGFYQAACRVFRDDVPDVIETAETGALQLARKPIAPLVMRLHGSNFTFQKFSGGPSGTGIRLDRSLELAALRRAAAITSPSTFQALELARTSEIPLEDIQVISNPVSAAILTRAHAARPVHPSATPLVLYTGRLAPVKGIVPLLEAAKEVCRSGSVKFTLAGPWQMGQAPAKFGFDPEGKLTGTQLSWNGHISWETIADLYVQATVFVMPSLFESFGISVIEAMAFGIPVVATTAGALPEVVEDGVTGLLVPSGDSGALAAAIKRLLNNAPLRARLGAAGRERVLARYTPERIAEKTLALYERVRRHTNS